MLALRCLKTVLPWAGLVFILTACGTEEGLVSLPFNDDDGSCNTVQAASLEDGTLESGDGRAVVTVSQAFTQPIQATLTVDCNTAFPSQIGRAYLLELDRSSANVQLSVSFAGLDLNGSSPAELQLGVYNTTNKEWEVVGSAVSDFQDDRVSVIAPLSGQRYAVFTPFGDSGGNTRPETPVITSIELVPAENAIRIRWDLPADPDGDQINSYIISRDPPGNQIATVIQPNLSFTDRGTEPNAPLESGTVYFYTVTAVDARGAQSLPSDRRVIAFP